ncbi:hypothetical protein AB0L22_08660 [Micromonospora haikouensis]|uniref:hypothetical protein n=1 Tax=Micromonospora haikouensis TaxID=686309 RepID=UPI003437A80E
MSRARGRQRRYENAVRRQIALVDAWDNATRVERWGMPLPAPVVDFLRAGDTEDMFRDDQPAGGPQ